MTAIGDRPKREIYFFPGLLRLTLLLKERKGDSRSGRGRYSD